MISVADGNIGPATFWTRPGTADEYVVGEVWHLHTYQWTGDDVTGAAVLDLGANVGAFTLWAAAAGAAHVRAVEPDPGNYDILCRNLSLNPALAERVETVRAAATPIADPRYQADTTRASGHVGADGVSVEGRTLGRLLDGLGDDILVKCDIEGSEHDLFGPDADDNDLARIARLVMEWHTGEPPARHPAEALGPLVVTLARHHTVRTVGRPNIGGMLWADRY